MNKNKDIADVITSSEGQTPRVSEDSNSNARLIEKLRAENNALRRSQKEILGSISWKITIPLRTLGTIISPKLRRSIRTALQIITQILKGIKNTVENEGWLKLFQKIIELSGISESSGRSVRFNSAKAVRWIKKIEQSQTARKVKDNPPLISIILPTRDRVALVKIAIESVIAQSYQNWELLVVDDGSTDDTVESVESAFHDKRIRILQSCGVGVCGARNCGLQEATGEFIAYLDSDNTWTPRYLELMIVALKANKDDSGYAILKCINQTPTIYRQKRFNYFDLKTKNFIDLNVFMHRRSLLDQVGLFDTSLKRMVDWDLILRITENQSVTFAPFIGAHYDSGPAADRITNSESLSYLDVVRDKHWTKWTDVEASIENRNPEIVSIIMCVFNQPDLTRKCVDSIFAHQAGVDFELILVDNGSKRPTKKVLKKLAKTYPNIKVVQNPENFNFALGNNIGFRHSIGARVVFLNNDTEVSPEWLGNLVEPLEHKHIKGTQPKLLYPDSTIQCVGVVFSEHSKLGYPIYLQQHHDLPATLRHRNYPAITGACMALRAVDFAKAKGFDPLFTNGQEDMDLCLRMGRGEAVFQYVPDSVVIHHESKTKGRTARIAHNRKLFIDRWMDQKVLTDRGYYAADNVQVLSYEVDSTQWEDPQLAAYQPTIELPTPTHSLPNYRANFRERVIAIKIGCPKISERENWGDYHFAVALVQCFMKRGIQARIDFLPDWYVSARPNDINFVLRGLSEFSPPASAINIMWLISHPQKVGDKEIQSYDHVFVASLDYTKTLRSKGHDNCEALLQCTDPNRFYNRHRSSDKKYDLLFVANSRKVERRIPKEAQKFNIPLAIFGTNWETFALDDWIYGERIPNRELALAYSDANVVLNDHWEDMQRYGFISNRIFDALACERPVVSDEIKGIPPEIRDAVVFFNSETGFDSAVQSARDFAATQLDSLRKISEEVRTKHSFDSRVEQILAVMMEKISVIKK